MKIAVAQIEVDEDINTNLKKILHYIDLAKDADLICFPETCLNGEEEVTDVSKHVKRIQKKCKEKSIYCIFGSYVPKMNKNRNVIFLINREGKILYKYYKVHLYKTEKASIVAGKTNRLVQTEFGPIGIINCWDFAFPSYIQKLSKKGARVIFCPSYLVSHKEDGPALRSIPLVRAFENLSYYISCDACTDETLSESYICHPQKVLKKIRKKEGIIFADLDFAEIDRLRAEYDHLC